jgi:hypothetical protein
MEKIIVNKEDFVKLYECVVESSHFISTIIESYIDEPDLRKTIIERLSSILYNLKNLYDFELIVLKEKANLLYIKWLYARQKDPESASNIYLEYLDIKKNIMDIEIPF